MAGRATHGGAGEQLSPGGAEPCARTEGGSAGGKRESLNNLSVVTQLTCGEQQMLFTGDAERDALARLTQVGSFGHITLLKVPHPWGQRVRWNVVGLRRLGRTWR